MCPMERPLMCECQFVCVLSGRGLRCIYKASIDDVSSPANRMVGLTRKLHILPFSINISISIYDAWGVFY